MKLGFAVLYLGLLVSANLATAQDWNALRAGDMRKFRAWDAPVAASAEPFTAEDGSEARLTDYAGRVVLVNFWATWCGPCRKEMPTLDALQEEMGGEEFEVVTIATGRNPPQAMTLFFEETGVEHLPLHRDESQRLARDMGVLGLPVSILLDRDGQEIGRLTGDADWASDEAKALISAVIAAE